MERIISLRRDFPSLSKILSRRAKNLVFEKFIVLTVLLSMCFTALPALAEQSVTKGVTATAKKTVSNDVQKTLNNAREAYDTSAAVTYEKMVPKPEDVQSAAKQCLDGILSTDFGFGLNVPSISDLLNKACQKINSEIKGYIQEKSKTFTPSYFNGLVSSEIGIGMGEEPAPVNQVDYDHKGDQIADSMWKDIKD